MINPTIYILNVSTMSKPEIDILSNQCPNNISTPQIVSDDTGAYMLLSNNIEHIAHLNDILDELPTHKGRIQWNLIAYELYEKGYDILDCTTHQLPVLQ